MRSVRVALPISAPDFLLETDCGVRVACARAELPPLLIVQSCDREVLVQSGPYLVRTFDVAQDLEEIKSTCYLRQISSSPIVEAILAALVRVLGGREDFAEKLICPLMGVAFESLDSDAAEIFERFCSAILDALDVATGAQALDGSEPVAKRHRRNVNSEDSAILSESADWEWLKEQRPDNRFYPTSSAGLKTSSASHLAISPAFLAMRFKEVFLTLHYLVEEWQLSALNAAFCFPLARFLNVIAGKLNLIAFKGYYEDNYGIEKTDSFAAPLKDNFNFASALRGMAPPDLQLEARRRVKGESGSYHALFPLSTLFLKVAAVMSPSPPPLIALEQELEKGKVAFTEEEHQPMEGEYRSNDFVAVQSATAERAIGSNASQESRLRVKDTFLDKFGPFDTGLPTASNFFDIAPQNAHSPCPESEAGRFALWARRVRSAQFSGQASEVVLYLLTEANLCRLDVDSFATPLQSLTVECLAMCGQRGSVSDWPRHALLLCGREDLASLLQKSTRTDEESEEEGAKVEGKEQRRNFTEKPGRESMVRDRGWLSGIPYQDVSEAERAGGRDFRAKEVARLLDGSFAVRMGRYYFFKKKI